ncbi:Ppx/GppA family phosphatase [Sphingosinithalassobacter sp. CS137]|uniref:Ppx/GppA family phosphatase n=1 Tax=Sphingosinithalassobacter sp. CS137 TaxID=2762748 RepID=UPI00165E1972|nr:Ppx/GppA family phosphatase [Sphingosinithalassobacter sp. CS137]
MSDGVVSSLLFRRARTEAAAAPPERAAIIDIGSNSIRLVVYQGPSRLPSVLFNEKVMAGLGRSLGATGAIDEAALSTARAALSRFAMLTREMQVTSLRTVATAAVREASNGDVLIATAKSLGLEVELLSGMDEAMGAGMGVLSGIPDADGIVGDLGGGSLELVRVVAGTVTDRASFPLGVLRVAPFREKGKAALERKVSALLHEAGWLGRGAGLPFYLVGGSWRALARLDMHLSGFPLPVIHQYAMSAEQVARLGRTLSHISKGKLRTVPGLSSGRIPTLGDAAAVLGSVLKALGSTETVVSAFGLREGLAFARLSIEERQQDPLITVAREEGARLGRFPEHGDLLDAWIAPLFEAEPAEMQRLRHAACLLGDVGWRANPQFRAERGMETALHGNWVAIDARGRAILAQALFTAYGGGTETPEPLNQLADAAELERAQLWGLAIRLGQRLSGGVAAPLHRTRLDAAPGAVRLTIRAGDEALYGEAVERRHRALANRMAADAVVAA